MSYLGIIERHLDKDTALIGLFRSSWPLRCSGASLPSKLDFDGARATNLVSLFMSCSIILAETGHQPTILFGPGTQEFK